MTRTQEPLPRAFLVVLVLAALGLRIPWLAESLWADEIWSTHLKVGSLHDLIKTAGRDIHPPGYLLLSYLWIKLAGDSEVAVRIPPLVFGLACIPLVYVIARRQFSDLTARLAALLLALSPVHVWYSHEARHYTALVAALLLAFAALPTAALEEKRGRSFGLYFLGIVAAASVHYYSMAFVALFSVWMILTRPVAWKRILFVNVIVGVGMSGLVLTRLAIGRMAFGRGYLRPVSAHEFFHTILNWFPTGNALEPVQMYGRSFADELRSPLLLAIELGVAVILVVGIVHAVRRRRPGELGVVAGFLVTPLFLVALALGGFREIYIERTMLPALPFFVILMAAGARALPGKIGQRFACFVVLGLTIAGLILGKVRYASWTVYKPNPEWRPAAAFLLREVDASPNAVAVLTTTPADVLRYYDDRFWREDAERELEATGTVGAILDRARSFETPRRKPENAIVLCEYFEELPPETQVVYLVELVHWQNRYRDTDANLRVLRGLEPQDTTVYGGLRIHRYAAP